mmetsp:Transcript_6256/g.7931  ORF Transcript_6256/g.7931 Transcript_6256/m.7931 type:complete len:276 (+) Transcript_6256:157-984(+)
MTEKCIICLEELHNNIGTISPCGHCFHVKCYNALKANKENDSSSCDKLRCPICKTKSKKFIPIYLSFEARENPSVGGGGDENECSSSCADATQAVASLTSENMRLRKSLQEMKTLSKNQSDKLIDILPRFDEVQARLSEISKDKEQIERELREVEEENSELLSGWNDIEMKNNELKVRLLETKRENVTLSSNWSKLDQKLSRARRKRKLIESRQTDELNNVKGQITKSLSEKQELFALLKKSQSEAIKLKRIVKKINRKQNGKKMRRRMGMGTLV